MDASNKNIFFSQTGLCGFRLHDDELPELR